jgi:3-deoxy-D-manno-octulosonate 8-phosphate phosphatase (KDO 8-P phosphatase)
MPNFNENLLISAARIDGLVLDVDGVLTDGKITYNNKGEESKNFHVRDGSSIKLLLKNGIDIAILSGRNSQSVERRAEELGITKIVLGAESKLNGFQKLREKGFASQKILAIGDDIADLELFSHPDISLSATVEDAADFVKSRVDFVTDKAGGNGIMFEIAELILTSKGLWPYEN